MERHLYYYTQHSAYLSDANRNVPNVSYCELQGDVHYNKTDYYVMIDVYWAEDAGEHLLLIDLDGHDADGNGDEIYYNINDVVESITIVKYITSNQLSLDDGVKASIPINLNEIDLEGCIDLYLTLTHFPTYTTYGLICGGYRLKIKLKENVELGTLCSVSTGKMTINLPSALLTSAKVNTSTLVIKTNEECTTIPYQAFDNDSNIGTLTLEEGISEIRAYAFPYCGLTHIDIPDSLTTVDNYAFFLNPNLDVETRTKLYAINPNVVTYVTSGE